MDLIQARALISGLMMPLATERIQIEDALSRVLAERLIADRNLPGEFRSRFDGYALRSDDTRWANRQAPVPLRIIPGHIAAGQAAAVGIGPGECMRILTGAPLPHLADAVAPQEEVKVHGEKLLLERAYAGGEGVTPPGADIREGEFLLAKGMVLTPSRLALIAALGQGKVTVYRQPQVALLATGDEVKALGALEEGPFTTCNNMYLLAWLTQLQGGKPSPLGLVGDESRAIATRLRDVDADLVITTGGMGKGDRDFILEAWEALGVRVLFSGINLIPGKNTAVGVRGKQVFLGVSGNPWAAQIVFEELAVPILRRWQGLHGGRDPLIAARLQESLKHKPGFYHAIRGALELKTTPNCFTPAGPTDASVFSKIRDCFGYILLEPHVVEVAAGSEVQVRLYDLPLLAFSLFRKG